MLGPPDATDEEVVLAAREADEILVMEDGKIIEQGTHEKTLGEERFLCRALQQPVCCVKRRRPDMVKLLVSACLLGENCKYSGGSNYRKELAAFLKEKEMEGNIQVFSVCPEVMGGLDTPRQPAEIKPDESGGSVWTKDGRDVTKEFQAGAKAVLKVALEQGCSIAILKERSPSCGSSQIYDGSFTSTVIKGVGLTARLLEENGIRVYHEGNFGEMREQI